MDARGGRDELEGKTKYLLRAALACAVGSLLPFIGVIAVVLSVWGLTRPDSSDIVRVIFAIIVLIGVISTIFWVYAGTHLI